MTDNHDTMPPLTLYLHIPFCVHKCPYCDFHSTVQETIPERRYLAAVGQELTLRRQQLANDSRPLQSLFLGGGTPSLLEPATMAGFLEHIMARWPLSTSCEITLEANPESATLEKMRDWRQMGINRLSLGIQAFDQERLQFLERVHTLETSRRAIRQARQAGFDNLNLDLIYATPGHTPELWGKELTEAMAWEPQHLSCYQLSIEPSTPFFQRSQDPAWVSLPETTEIALFHQTRQTLAKGGWSSYETSNFAKTMAFSCRHNRNYWSFGDYLGIGCGAHGKLSTVMDDTGRIGIERSLNPKTPETYMATLERDGCALQTLPISAAEAGQEYLLMGLRHDQGVQHALYQRLTGEVLLTSRAKSIGHLADAGFLSVDSYGIRLTEKGIPLADAITLALL